MATTTSDEVSLSARGRVNGDPKSGAPSSEIGDDLNAVTPWAIESDPTATVGSSVFSGPHAKLTLEDAGMAQAVQPAAGSCAAQERLDSTSSSERMMVVLDTTPPAIRNANQSAGMCTPLRFHGLLVCPRASTDLGASFKVLLIGGRHSVPSLLSVEVSSGWPRQRSK